MFCRICGKPIPDDTAFCPHCGTDTAQPDSSFESSLASPVGSSANADSKITADVKPGRKKSTAALVFAAISVLLAAALVLSFLGILPSPFGASAATLSTASSQSFATPEDAIKSFVESLKAGDYDGALSKSAANNISGSFDYRKYVEHAQAIWPVGKTYMPADYPQFVEYNRYKYSNELLEKMLVFSATLSLSEDNAAFVMGDVGAYQDEKTLDDFISELNPENIDTLEIIKIAATKMQNDEKTQEILKLQAAPLGADDMQCLSVLYKNNGKYYMGGFTLLQYNGKWQVYDMSDPLNGLALTIVIAQIPDEATFDSTLESR